MPTSEYNYEMKPNLIFKILVITLMGLPVLLKAQVSESFTLTQNELIFQKNADFDELITKDYSFTDEIGNPQLPIRIESFVVPYDAIVSGLQITSVTKQKVKGKFYIYPTQPPRPLDGSEPPAFVEPNPAVYNSSEPYPGKTVEIISDEYMHGYHIVTVKIYPVEYIPKNRELYLQDISFTINYSSSKIKSNSIIQPEKQSYKRAELAKKFIEGYVKNVTDVENFKDKDVKIIDESSSLNKTESTDVKTIQLKSTSVIEELVPDYIIITNEELKPTFQTLADWKTKKGLPAIIKTIEEIEPNYPGSDLPEKIRNYLKEAYSKWGASLYILLGGDVNIVPARMVNNVRYPSINGVKPTDLYYTTIGGAWNANNNNVFGESGDTVDYGPDFILGRASIEDLTEAQTFVNKVIAYEKYSNLGISSYVNNYLCLVGFLDENVCGVFLNGPNGGYPTYSNELKNIATTYMPTNINRWFLFDNYDCQYNSSNPYSTPYAYYTHQYEQCNPSEPTVNYVKPGGGTCLTGNQTLNKTNAISCLNNGGSSGLGNFHIVYHLQHSGVKGMGVSRVTDESFRNEDFDFLSNGNYNQILFTNGCSPGTFDKDCIGEHYINKSQGGGVAFIGNADVGWYGEHWQFQYFSDALYETTGHPSTGYNLGFVFQKAQGTSSSSRKRLTLLGDPEMPVWTNTPQTLNVSVSPTTVVSGENTIVVTINNLPSGKTATICLQKGDEGYATQTVSANGSYNFTFTPHTSGQINVTVTSHNFKPYESIITVNTNQNQNIFISNMTFDDDKTGSSNGNNDQQIDAGETIELTVELKNNGASSATNVSATLTCSSPYVSISNNNSSYGNISSGGTKTSLTKYVFTIDKDAPEILVNDLNPVKFILQITDGASNSYTDVFNIDVFKPDIEQANKTIVTTSDGDKIIEPNETVTINIDLFNKGKAQATGITGVLAGNSSYITSCSSTPRNYPAIDKFGTETNTSVYQFTVSSSYTVGQVLDFILQVENEFGKTWSFNFNLLDKPAKINTSTIDFTADKTEIELFWTPYTNISGYNIKELFTNISVDNNNSYLIGLNSDGTELFDIDGNLTTYSGFAYLNAGMNSTPAIGDLESNGQYKVISMTRSGSPDYFSNHSVNDNNSDGKPDLIWQHTAQGPCYRPPIVSNLDNSSDGTLETIFYSEWGGIRVYSATGQLLYSFADGIGGTYGSLSLADIDGNGDKEIIGCYKNNDINHLVITSGIYIWHHNGTNYGTSQPFYTISVYEFSSSPVICDIDNDGDKEILACALVDKSSTTTPSEGRIVAIHHNGTVVSGWNGTQKLSYPNDWHSQDISVGDLNNDGNLEVVAIGTNIVKVWNKSGTQISSTTISNLNPGKLTPILADVDNDADIEIIFGSNDEGRIHALNMDGTKVLGFPLHVDDALQGSPCIADVDNNGKSELIAGSGNKIYMWETNGNSQLIEWGSERHDPQNTGEYYEICPPTIITSNTTWSTNKNLCGDIIINSGTLTIASTCTVTMSDYTRVLVNSGGELKVDAGKIMNANIKALSGSNIILKNNGYIKISDHGEFIINTGATFDYQYGTLDITQ